VHLFGLMRFFAGDALWCSARVLQNGEEITLAHARAATENIGPVAGEEIMAEFAFGRESRRLSRAGPGAERSLAPGAWNSSEAAEL